MFCRRCGCEILIPYGDFLKLRRKIIRTYKCIKCGFAHRVLEKMK